MKAIILSAGLGTRLRPLTARWPKPAMPVLGQPLFRYALAILRRAGATAIGINTHHLPHEMEAIAAAECARAGLPLTVSHEPEIQGTGGGIRGLRQLVHDGTFVVTNGDILFAVDLAPILAGHRASGAAATMVLMPMPPGESYAAVEIDPERRVRRIAGHGPPAPSLTPWHFTGVHVLTPAVFDFMSAEGPQDINREVYVQMIGAGLQVHAELVSPTAVYWSDLGTPQRLAATHRDLLAQRVPMHLFAGSSPFELAPPRAPHLWASDGARLADARIAGPALFSEGSELGRGVRIGAGVWVGQGARVGEGAQLNRVLVMPGAQVPPGDRLEDCIVVPGGVGEAVVIPSA